VEMENWKGREGGKECKEEEVRGAMAPFFAGCAW